VTLPCYPRQMDDEDTLPCELPDVAGVELPLTEEERAELDQEQAEAAIPQECSNADS
jgi:hypothetical protein